MPDRSNLYGQTTRSSEFRSLYYILCNFSTNKKRINTTKSLMFGKGSNRVGESSGAFTEYVAHLIEQKMRLDQAREAEAVKARRTLE